MDYGREHIWTIFAAAALSGIAARRTTEYVHEEAATAADRMCAEFEKRFRPAPPAGEEDEEE